MSGIAAVCNTHIFSNNGSLLQTMASIMAIRGPDAQHYLIDEQIGLVHCLLHTVEGVPEAQPMRSMDGNCWLISDVRIDGRDELCERIRQEGGEAYIAATDEQLVMLSYQIWGVDCVNYLIGDFAFILWDKRNKRLFCATDQFGVCPLYYAKTKEGICISNTLNVLRLHPDISDELDPYAQSDYLIFRRNQNPRGTSFKDIRRLPGSHYLVFEHGKLSEKCYWSLPPREEILHRSKEQYIQEFDDLLRQAVSDRIRLPRLGAHLSGGMDSSSVVSIALELLKGSNDSFDLQTFTEGGANHIQNIEGPLAMRLAEQLGLPNHQSGGRDGLLASEEMPLHLESPEPAFMSRDIARYYHLNKVSGYARLMLSGFGGDPLLQSEPLKLGDFGTAKGLLFMLQQSLFHRSEFGRFPPVGLRSRRPKTFPSIHIPDYISPEFSEKYNIAERLRSISDLHHKTPMHQAGMSKDDPWRRLFSWNDPGFTHIPVKVAHPFFDIRLIEYAQKLPPYPWLFDKYILRRCMAKRLPSEVIERPKTPSPGSSLAMVLNKGKTPGSFLDLLCRPELEPYVRGDLLAKKLLSGEPVSPKTAKIIMSSATLAHWLKSYIEIPRHLRDKSKNVGNEFNPKRVEGGV